VNFFLHLLFWLTPVVYQFETVPEAYRPLFLYANPLTSLIVSWRELFLLNHLRWESFLLAFLGAFVVLLLGLLIYQKLNKRVDEFL
jgi:ABC-type polysaccharide/polyol phosphate export permease